MRNKKTGFKEYKNMHHEFKPFVMFTNADDYKTSIVNTDKFGFRKTYFENKLIGLEDINSVSTEQNVLLGGSTAFSMGSSSDKNTLSTYLTEMGDFCYSLGVRASTSQQELLTYLMFKRFFSKIKNIIIFSGVNDIVLCATKNSFYYPDFGGVFAEDMRFSQFWMQHNYFQTEKWQVGRNNLYNLINFFSNKSFLVKFFLSLLSNKFFSNKSYIRYKKFNNLDFNEKLLNFRKIISNDIETWSSLTKNKNINLIYILQPLLNWSKKKRTMEETKIIEEEKNRFDKKFYDSFTDYKTYNEHKNFLQRECAKNSINFHDSNEWIDESESKESFFIDQSHLSNYGNLFISKKINKLLIK
jgi:hypothetical protein